MSATFLLTACHYPDQRLLDNLAPWFGSVLVSICISVVALTHISAYSTHKNLAVRKIADRCVQNTQKSGIQSHEANNRRRHTGIVKGRHSSFVNSFSVFC